MMKEKNSVSFLFFYSCCNHDRHMLHVRMRIFNEMRSPTNERKKLVRLLSYPFSFLFGCSRYFLSIFLFRFVVFRSLIEFPIGK